MLQIIIGMIREPLQFDIVHLSAQQSLQHRDDVFEVWSRGGVGFPAVVHYVVELPATVLGLLKAMAFADLE